MKKISGLGQRIESLGSLNCPTSVIELKRKITSANHRKPDLIIKINIVNVFQERSTMLMLRSPTGYL
jgi:hypothetical protein